MAYHPPSDDPKIASLRAIFPTLDLAVVQAVLAQHDGNEDRAVESLLSLTDDTFVPPERPGEETLRAQAELDASYARALAMEEENAMAQQQRTRSSRQIPERAADPPLDPSNLPYQPRVRRSQPSPYIHNPPVKNYNNSYDYHYGSDATREADQPQPGFEERFQKLAVTGQQTFNTFLNSGFMKGVKDKVASATAAATQQQPARQNSGSQHSTSQYGESSSSSASPLYPSNTAPRTQNPDYPASDWQLPSSTRETPSSSAASSINVYQPSSQYPTPSAPRTFVSPPTSTGKRSDEFSQGGGGRHSPSLLATSPPSSGALSSSPGAAGKIDFAKLGLLPKQKISLDGKATSGSAPTTTSTTIAGSSPIASHTNAGGLGAMDGSAVKKLTAQEKLSAEEERKKKEEGKKADESEDDEDALEYSVNPFEEGR